MRCATRLTLDGVVGRNLCTYINWGFLPPIHSVRVITVQMRHQPVNRVAGAYPRFWDGNETCRGAWRPSLRRVMATITLFIAIQVAIAAYTYYYCYEHVYPGSKTATVIDRSYSVFHFVYWASVAFAIIFNFVLSFLVCCYAVGPIQRWFPCYRLAGAVMLCVVGSWPIWISALIDSIWQNAVWDNACHGWDITAVLEGIGSVDTLGVSTYSVGLATIVLASGGSYTMQLFLQPSNSSGVINYDNYKFNVTEQVNHIPPLSNITYIINATTTIYSTNDTTGSYSLDPNLSFPSLGLELNDPSIPFATNGSHPPAANLVLHNGSHIWNVLNTVTLSPSNCTLLKVCGTTHDGMEEDFQIALGVVLMEQFVYSIACSKGSGVGSYSGGSESGGLSIYSSPQSSSSKGLGGHDTGPGEGLG